MAGVAEVAERLRRAPATPDLRMQAESLLVALNRFGVTPEMLVGVPEAVQRGGHPILAADLAGQLERLPGVNERFWVVPEQGVEPGHRVEGQGPAVRVVSGGVGIQGPLRLALDLAG